MVEVFCNAHIDGIKGEVMGLILLIVLFVLLIGVLPTWPHSRNWGYYPSGGIGLVLLVVFVLFLTGRMHF
jgi:hypothetical protein